MDGYLDLLYYSVLIFWRFINEHLTVYLTYASEEKKFELGIILQ